MFRQLLVFLLISLKSFCQSESIATSAQANQLYKIATDHFFDLETKKSVHEAEKVLIFSLRNNDKILAAKTYNLLGLNFEQFSDEKRAISYYKKGVKIALEIKNDTILGWLYNNLGGIYSYNGIDLKKGTQYFLKAYTCTKKIKNNPEFLVASLNIGSNLMELGKYEEGKKYLDGIKEKVDLENEADVKLALHSYYANYYDAYKNDFKNAEKEYLEAIKIGLADKTPAIKMNLLDIYYAIYTFYERNKKNDKAFEYLKLHDKLQSKLYDDKREAILSGEDKSIQIGEISHRIEEVERENKNYIRILKYNKYFILFLIVLILTFLSLLYFLHKNYKKNKKINKKLKITNVELHRAKLKTIEAAKLKTQFMSTVSHELRTPLYGVIGLTDIIESEHAELQDSKYIKSLKFSAKYLLSLINDVLNISKIESGNLELIYEPINLKEQIEIIVDSLEVMANQYNNKIVISFDSDLPIYIKTDKTRLSQIIINLISNSLKFTKEGIITIKVGKTVSNDFLLFKIEDNGIGIPKKYIDKVFEKFIQVERNSDEQFQGTGLGLAIVKRFVDLFGGKISIQSEENIGTVIEFSIPLIVAKKIEMLNEDYDELHKLINCKILVVEDNNVNQIVTQKLLEKNKLECVVANDGYHAIEILKQQTFDIILMDIHMPGINGFETTEIIHQLGIETPIIALTASDKHEIEEDVLKYKMKDILNKPFEYKELEKLIKKHI